PGLWSKNGQGTKRPSAIKERLQGGSRFQNLCVVPLLSAPPVSAQCPDLGGASANTQAQVDATGFQNLRPEVAHND
ncbi:hypothetical protein JMJ77_0003583, partial [Colletotrichum scovillei]